MRGDQVWLESPDQRLSGRVEMHHSRYTGAGQINDAASFPNDWTQT